MKWGILLVLTLWAGPSYGGTSADSLVKGVEPFQDNAALTGVLDHSSECQVVDGRKRAQLWVSVGQVLLYQVEVPVQGSYEFHLLPGKYDVVATNEKGCLAQQQLTLKPRQVARLDLKLEPARGAESSRKPASLKGGQK